MSIPPAYHPQPSATSALSVGLVRLLDGTAKDLRRLSIPTLCREASVRGRKGPHPSLASIEEVVRVLAGYHHVDFTTGLAAELFKENRLEPFLNRMYPKKAGRSERSRARRVLNLCAAVWSALGAINVDELPPRFKSRLRTLIILREISPSLLAKLIGVHRNVMANWVRDGGTMPTFGFRTHLREAEIVLDVPERTLTGLPDVQHIWIPSRRAALATAKQTENSQALAELKAFFAARHHGHSLPLKDWPAGLQNEWRAILAARPVQFDDSTREEYEYIAGCYFAFLLDSKNVALADLSFALLARLDWCEEYLELERGLTVGKTYNSRADVLLGSLAGPLLEAKRGWVWRQENFCSLAPFAGEVLPVYQLETGENIPRGHPLFPRCAWSDVLMKARAALASLRKRIADARRNSPDHSSVELIVKDENPFRFVQMLIGLLDNRASTVIKPDQKRMAVRTLAMVLIAIHFNLLATSLALIRVGVHLFPRGDHFRLRLTRFEAGFVGYDGDGVFIDREVQLADSPLLARAVLDQIASMRDRNPDLQGRFLFEQRERYRGHDLNASLLTMAMSDLTKRYLGVHTGGRGFGFGGLRRILEAAFDAIGEHEVAQQIRYPFRTPDPNAINTRALRHKQQRVLNDLATGVFSAPTKDQVA